MTDEKKKPEIAYSPAPAEMTVRDFIAAKQLEPWQVAALLPHAGDLNSTAKVDDLEKALARALKERI